MKKIYPLFFILACCLFSGCYKQDVSILYSRQHRLEQELAALETVITQINSSSDLLMTLINAHLNEDHLTRVVPLPDNGGYNMYFSISGLKTVYNGLCPEIGPNGTWIVDGVDTGIEAAGVDGICPEIGPDGTWIVDNVDTGIKAAGSPGTSGTTPVIGVSKDASNPTDDNYYWTQQVGSAPAEFILDSNGQKINAIGEPGANGISPIIGIAQHTDMEYYWTITIPTTAPSSRALTDGEQWLLVDGQKVPATGQKGDKGDPGDSFFKGINNNDPDSVYFIINSDPADTISVPRYMTISLAMDSDTLKFNDFYETKTIPFTVSDNVVSVITSSHDGWYVNVDMDTKIVTVTSPHILNVYAERGGEMSLIALDNKGMSTSTSIYLEMNTTIHLQVRNASGGAFTAAQVPYGIRVFYVDTDTSYADEMMENELLDQETCMGDGIVNTFQENRTSDWSMVAFSDDPNVTWDIYTYVGAHPALTDIEAALKPSADKSGWFMPLASNALDMWWQKATFAQGVTTYANPTIMKVKNVSAKVTVNLYNVSGIAVTGVPRLPTPKNSGYRSTIRNAPPASIPEQSRRSIVEEASRRQLAWHQV